MLAKDIKIQTILRQRAFIEKQLSHLGDIENRDGDPAYSYNGYIYPENIIYFQDAGFEVTPKKSDMLTAALKGRPLHVFTPKDMILLSEEDMKKAEELLKHEQEEMAQMDDEIRALAGAAADDFLGKLFNGRRPYADPFDEPDDSENGAS